MFKWPGRPRKTLLGGSLRYQFVFLHIRIFKTCSYRMELRRCDRWRCLRYVHLDCDMWYWHYIYLFDMLQWFIPKVRLDRGAIGCKGTHLRSPMFHAQLQSPRLYSRSVRVRMQVSGWWPINRLATCTHRIARLYIINMASNYKVGRWNCETNGNNWTKHEAMIPSPEYQIQY